MATASMFLTFPSVILQLKKYKFSVSLQIFSITHCTEAQQIAKYICRFVHAGFEPAV